MKQNLQEELLRLKSMMGLKNIISEGLSLGRIFSNISDIADSLILKVVNNAEKLAELGELATEKDASKTAQQWVSEIRGYTKRDWEDLLGYTGKLKFLFSDPHSAISYLVENSSKAADDVMEWMKNTDISDLDKQQMRDLLESIRVGKGWTKDSPGYKAFKESTPTIKNNINWINTKSTKTATKYFTDVTDEELFRTWINIFEDGKYARQYDIDIYQPGVTKSDWVGLGNALNDPYIVQNWVNAAVQRNLLQQLKGVWNLPSTKKYTFKLPGNKKFEIKVPKNPLAWYTNLPKAGQWIVGLSAVGLIGLSTASMLIPWIMGKTLEAGTESAQKVYEELQRQIDEFLRGFKDETVDGPLVRNIFDETVTLGTLQTKYDKIPWSSYIAITDEQASEIAKQLLIPSFKQPIDTEIPKFSIFLSNAIKMRIYGLVPDGISLMKVVEEFKKLPESGGKNPHDYYFDQLTYYFTTEKNELNENTYINMTDAPSGEGMVLTVLLPAQILSIDQPDLKIDQNFLNKLKSGQIKFQIPQIDKDELLNTKAKVETLILPTTWVMKPSKDGARYKGISLNDFSDWGETCAEKVDDKDKLKSELKKIIISYLETQTRKKVKFDDLFLTDNIVEYVNSKFPCEGFRGRLDFADPNILTKGNFAPIDYTPEPQKPAETNPKLVTPNPVEPKQKTNPDYGPNESINNKIVGLASLLTEQINKDWFWTLFQDVMNRKNPTWFNGTTIKQTDAEYGTKGKVTSSEWTNAKSATPPAFSTTRENAIVEYFLPDYGILFRFKTADGRGFNITQSTNQVLLSELKRALVFFPTNLVAAFYSGVMSVPEYKNIISEIQVSDEVANILKANQTAINQYLQ